MSLKINTSQANFFTDNDADKQYKAENISANGLRKILKDKQFKETRSQSNNS